MPGPLAHGPAQVIQYLLVQLGLGALPPTSSPWPVFRAAEPDLPDNCITVFNTAGVKQGRTQWDGERQGTNGITIRVRSTTPRVGATKANAIAQSLDKNVWRTEVAVAGTTYTVQGFKRTGDVIHIGPDQLGQGDRTLHNINGLVSLRQVLGPTGDFLLISEELGGLQITDDPFDVVMISA